MQNLVYEWVDFPNVPLIWAKIGSNLRTFWKNRVILIKIWPKNGPIALVYEWVTFSWKIGIYMGLLSNSVVAHPYQNQTRVPPPPGLPTCHMFLLQNNIDVWCVLCLFSDDDFSPEDLFNMFFGGGFPEPHVAQRRQRFRQHYTRTRTDEVSKLCRNQWFIFRDLCDFSRNFLISRNFARIFLFPGNSTLHKRIGKHILSGNFKVFQKFLTILNHTYSVYYLLNSFQEHMHTIAVVMCVTQLAARLHSKAEFRCGIGHLPHQGNCSSHSNVFWCLDPVQKTSCNKRWGEMLCLQSYTGTGFWPSVL